MFILFWIANGVFKTIYINNPQKLFQHKYNFLLVGSGLFSAVFAHEAKKRNKSCLVIEKRKHIGGNIYTRFEKNISVHMYGAHIFHTNEKFIWEYINTFADFNRYTNSPIAFYNESLYNLPFNMNTFHRIWPNITTPFYALKKISEQSGRMTGKNSEDLEEQAISFVGEDIYRLLIKGYTEKQWGKKCNQLPSSIIKRIPVRWIFDNNYFDDRYQGIPIGGYTQIIEKMFEGFEIQTSTDYFLNRTFFDSCAEIIIFTGMIDEYFSYRFGELEYRGLYFETESLTMSNFQGNAVINYVDEKIPYTRIIEHKHFEFGKQPETIITYEYPKIWKRGDEAFYPINDDNNTLRFKQYLQLALKQGNVFFGGRLGMYCYFDMDDTILASLSLVKKIFHEES